MITSEGGTHLSSFCSTVNHNVSNARWEKSHGGSIYSLNSVIHNLASSFQIEQGDQIVLLTFRLSLGTVALHSHMRVQMIECAVCFLTTIPSTRVQPLDFFVAPSLPLMLLHVRNWDEQIDH